MAGFLCAQTAVIKLTKAGPARLNALGRLTTSYTIGGTLGPFLGGKLGASGDYYVGARYATAGSLLAVALVFLLPSSLDKDGSTPEKRSDTENKKAAASSSSWLSKVSSILSLVWIFLFVKLATSVANSMARSSQPLILKSLGADESLMGTVMAVQFGFGGTLMGMEHAIFALSYLIGPQVGIHTYGMYGITGLSLGCASIFATVYFMLLVCKIPEHSNKKQE
eukprot:g152.t1